jgi:hypothetical protein
MANHILLPDGDLIVVQHIAAIYIDDLDNLNIVINSDNQWALEHDNPQQAKNSMRSFYSMMITPQSLIATIMFNGELTQSLEKEKQFLENI